MEWSLNPAVSLVAIIFPCVPLPAKQVLRITRPLVPSLFSGVEFGKRKTGF